MPESIKSAAQRRLFNLFPVLRRSGGRITYMSADNRELHMSLNLTRNTRNYVGTIYGGCMYSAIDGIYMVMFIRLLGSAYIVWDKSANIEYLKPGKGKLTTQFVISDEQLNEIKEALTVERSIRRTYPVEWKDAEGDVVCRIEKNLYFRAKQLKSD